MIWYHVPGAILSFLPQSPLYMIFREMACAVSSSHKQANSYAPARTDRGEKSSGERLD